MDTLKLNNNNLRALPHNIFHGLSKLENLNLENNELTNLPHNLFRGLSYLGLLYLGNNNMTHLFADVFSDLSNLRYLGLCQKKLSLPANVFHGLSNLSGLSLHKSTHLPRNAFSDFFIFFRLGNCELYEIFETKNSRFMK